MAYYKIGISCDHAGYEMKQAVISHLMAHGHTVQDFGCYSPESCDYPDFAHALGHALETRVCTFGVALCGSANGISMTLNKHRDVRAAICWEPELAVLARRHNDANVCSLPARFISVEMALRIVDTFFAEAFEGGRHARRVEKINLPQ